MNSIFALASFLGVNFAVGFISEVLYQKRRISSLGDERAAKIIELLPMTDCEKCGLKSCRDFAMAAAASPEMIFLCARSSSALKRAAQNIWGYTSEFSNPDIARVHCAATLSICHEKFRYYGVKNCAGVNLLWSGNRECTHGCVGFGDCNNVCPTGAIELTDNFLPKINELACIGCGRCVAACPFSVIRLHARKIKTYVRCKTIDPGKVVHKICPAGCISCYVCVKACPHHAFEHGSGAPEIMSDRCTNCGICALKCPTGVISCVRINENVVMINTEKCNLCGICAEICKTKAIEAGDHGFQVIDEKCIGCGLCVGRCPKGAIVVKVQE